MSFTSEVKKEIVARGVGQGKEALAQKRACVSAFVRTSGVMGISQGKPSFFLVNETESIAEFITLAFSEVFLIRISCPRGRRLVV